MKVRSRFEYRYRYHIELKILEIQMEISKTISIQNIWGNNRKKKLRQNFIKYNFNVTSVDTQIF